MRDGPEQVDLDRADAYGRSFGDVYDRWYDGVTDAEATADFVAARHCDLSLPVLELGIGTGRLAIPMARRGLRLVGLDASADMLDRVPTGAAAVGLVRADMRALPFARGDRPGDGPFATVLVAFNTLFNLTHRREQAALLTDLARLLSSGGQVIVEMLDVSQLVDGPDRAVGLRDRTTDPVVVTATELDRDRQRLWGQHLEISDRGVVHRPWVVRWVTPAQLDGMADAAGLALAERFGSWTGAPLATSALAGTGTVVSVYRATITP